jgi:hypothetical protein
MTSRSVLYDTNKDLYVASLKPVSISIVIKINKVQLYGCEILIWASYQVICFGVTWRKLKIYLIVHHTIFFANYHLLLLYCTKMEIILILSTQDPNSGDWVVYRHDLEIPSFLSYFPICNATLTGKLLRERPTGWRCLSCGATVDAITGRKGEVGQPFETEEKKSSFIAEPNRAERAPWWSLVTMLEPQKSQAHRRTRLTVLPFGINLRITRRRRPEPGGVIGRWRRVNL